MSFKHPNADEHNAFLGYFEGWSRDSNSSASHEPVRINDEMIDRAYAALYPDENGRQRPGTGERRQKVRAALEAALAAPPLSITEEEARENRYLSTQLDQFEAGTWLIVNTRHRKVVAHADAARELHRRGFGPDERLLRLRPPSPKELLEEFPCEHCGNERVVQSGESKDLLRRATPLYWPCRHCQPRAWFSWNRRYPEAYDAGQGSDRERALWFVGSMPQPPQRFVVRRVTYTDVIVDRKTDRVVRAPSYDDRETWEQAWSLNLDLYHGRDLPPLEVLSAAA